MCGIDLTSHLDRKLNFLGRKKVSALIPLVGPDGQVKRGGELNLWPFLLFSFGIILLSKVDILLYLSYVLSTMQTIKQG